MRYSQPRKSLEGCDQEGNRVGCYIERSRTVDLRTEHVTRQAEPVEVADSACAACCPPVTGAALSTGEAAETAEVFKALAHPHRVQLVNLLAQTEHPVCVADICAVLGLAQSTASHHLKLLVGAGLLRREQQGIWAYYSVDRGAMSRLASIANPEIIQDIRARIDQSPTAQSITEGGRQ